MIQNIRHAIDCDMGDDCTCHVSELYGLHGYELTAAALRHAGRLIDLAELSLADSLIRNSGASRADLSDKLGSGRLRTMAQWAQENTP